MPIRLAGNSSVPPGEPAFLIASDRHDGFELGRAGGDDYWLLGEIVGPERQFLFNGRLFLPDRPSSGTIIDSFPKGPAPLGWTKHQLVDREGYKLAADDGTVLFGYEVLPGRSCRIIVNIYAADGRLVGETTDENLVIHRLPARFGKRGILLS